MSGILYDAQLVDQMLNSVEDSETKTILLLAWEAALTPLEIANLKWSDVDLEGRKIRIGWRETPISERLWELLRDKAQKSSYVIRSRKDDSRPMNRVSVSRKAQMALSQSRLKDASLQELQKNCVVRMLQTHPIEEVYRMTGREPRSLRAIYQEYMDGEVPAHIVKNKDCVTDGELLKALETAGDCLETRAVFLSWQGGVKTADMIHLRWSDIDLEQGLWKLGGKQEEIPPVLLDRLIQWRANDGGDRLLLRGENTQDMLELGFLSRRISVFFTKHHLEFLKVNVLRGKGAYPEEKEQICKIAKERGGICTATISKKTGIPQGRVEWRLNQLVEEGQLQLVRGKGYLDRDVETPDRVIAEAIESHKQSGGTVAMKEIQRETGLPYSNIEYYLNKKMKLGELERTARGVYKIKG